MAAAVHTKKSAIRVGGTDALFEKTYLASTVRRGTGFSKSARVPWTRFEYFAIRVHGTARIRLAY